MYKVNSTEVPQFNDKVSQLYNDKIERLKADFITNISINVAIDYKVKEICKESLNLSETFKEIATTGISIKVGENEYKIYRSWQNIKYRFYCKD